MEVTVFGLILAPLSVIWAYRPVRLVQLALLVAVFEAAAAFIFGGFGLQTAMIPGLMLIIYVFSQYALGMRYRGEGVAVRAALPLIALLCYALVSAWLLPQIFAGRIMVAPQKYDPLALGLMVPLQFTFGNVTQSLYLAFDVVSTIAVAVFMTRAAIPYQSIIAAYMLGGYVVAVLTFWQLGNRLAGVPFPDDLLHSNPGWVIVEQAFGAVPRVQGPFSEPSALGGYMSGIAFCSLWLSIRGYSTMRPSLLFGISIACTLLSTSTTGIVTLVVGLPIMIGIASIGSQRGAIKRIGGTMGRLLMGALLLVGPLLILKPSLLDSIETVVEATLNKGESDSYKERSSWDAGALATLGPTYGLGVGWGSYRSSSFIPGLVANGGLFGLTMVFWLLLRIWRLATKARKRSPGHPGRILVDGFSASLFSQMATALIAAPMITSLNFYLPLGCVIGVLARMVIEPKTRRATQN